jgi:hypothetical protein
MVDIVDASPAAPVPEPEAEAEPAPAHPDPSSIPPDAWRRFESAALGVLNKIQPTVTSEHFRSAVIDYLQRLLGSRAGVQVLYLLCSAATFPAAIVLFAVLVF